MAASTPPAGRVLGVDAAGPGGWVGVVLDGDGRFEAASIGVLTTLVVWAEPVEVVGIDIPIGLGPDGARAADLAARAFVGPRRSSVFATPPAHVLDIESYPEANAMLGAAGLPKLSRQAWALIPKIREAQVVAATDDRLREVHPEVSFCAMADGAHLAWSKKTWNGQHVRRRLLASAGIELPDSIPDIAGTPADDLLDAAAVAWSARRIARGESRTFPDEPEQHGGRAVAIWC